MLQVWNLMQQHVNKKSDSLYESLVKLSHNSHYILNSNLSTDEFNRLLTLCYSNCIDELALDDSTELKTYIHKYFQNLQASFLCKEEFLEKRKDIFQSFEQEVKYILTSSLLKLSSHGPDSNNIPVTPSHLKNPPIGLPLSPSKFTKRSNYPKNVTLILKTWLENNLNHPYPDEEQKYRLSRQTGLCLTQINNWFINARRRILPDLAEKMTPK